MYAQHNRRHRGRGYDRSRDWSAQGRGRGRDDRSNCPNVECYNCGKYRHYARNCYAKKRVEEDANLVEEDEGILMMTNEGITMNSDLL